MRPAGGPDDCIFDASLTPGLSSLTPQDRQFDPHLTPEGGQTEIGEDSKESGDSDAGIGQFASLPGETHPHVSVHASKSYRYSVNGAARAAEARA